jgi:hypothetical protein
MEENRQMYYKKPSGIYVCAPPPVANISGEKIYIADNSWKLAPPPTKNNKCSAATGHHTSSHHSIYTITT